MSERSPRPARRLRRWPQSPAAKDLLLALAALATLMALPSPLALLALSILAAFGLAGLRLRPASADQSANPRLGGSTPEDLTQGVKLRGSRRLSQVRRRDRLRAWPLALTLILSLVAFAASELSRWGAVTRDGALRRISEGYRGELEALAAQASAVAQAVDAPADDDEAARLQSFRQLEAALDLSRSGPGSTVLLVDPDSAITAWIGEGLRHDLSSASLPERGLHFVRSFTAVTVYAVQPLEEERRPWRVVVGRSYSTTELPFAALPDRGASLPMWTLRAAGDEEEAPERWTDVDVADLPVLRLREVPDAGPLLRPLPRGLGWWILALGFTITGLAHTLAVVAGESGPEVFGLTVGFATLAGVAFGASEGSGPASLLFVVAMAWLALAWRLRRRLAPWSGAVSAAVALLVVVASSRFPSVGLGDARWAEADGWLLRLGLLALLGGAVLSRDGKGRGERWLWLALALGAGGAALVERPLLSLLFLVVGAASLGSWRVGRGRGGDFVAAAVAGAVLSSGLWSLGTSWRSAVAGVPPALQASELAASAQEFFESLDVGELALGDADLLAERQDLALALWRPSPLRAFAGASAILVRPGEGPDSRFSFGLPIDIGPGGVDSRDPSWRSDEQTVEPHEDRASLLSMGRFWGEVHYWWAEMDGRLDARPPLDTGELARELLSGGFASGSRATGAGASSGSGEWPASARALEALLRAGVNAAASVTLLFLGGLLALPLAMAMPKLRESLRRFLSSYSRKLILVSTLLLMLPMALFSLFLFRTVSDRLIEEQRTNGEAALSSAVRLLEDYLPVLEPGFSLAAELDIEMMTWLSTVVSHDLNLYWRGYEAASSRPELFVAGLLPKRIPGDVFSRLALAGERVVSRVNSAVGGPSYLELYAPVSLPGETPARGLFLSVPLLAQQEEAARELQRLTHQAVMMAWLVLLVLFRVTARLAESFSTPLMQLVEGTDRIAKGATSLGLDPKEPELSALAEAIDHMARRIDEGRQRLIREKQVVESVVANINSAVISIGADDRVQMCNSLARGYLDVEIGQPVGTLADSLLGEPLAALMRQRPEQLTHRTVRLASGEGEEQEWTLVWVPVAGSGDPAALLVIEDVTEVLRAQRLEAWAEMARMIAHEIKNPLTPIRLSAEHLRRVRSEAPERLEEIFDRCIDNILEQVAELRRIAAEFSAFSRIPQAELELGDLSASVAEVVEAYRASPPDGLVVSFEAAPEPVVARFDQRLIGRAVRNLLENAIHASSEGGTVRVSVGGGQQARIVVSDRGCGVPPEHLSRIFEPNFSTSSGGTGLGLAITRRIVREHGGSLVAENQAGGGLAVTIDLPLAESGGGRSLSE